MSLCRQLVKYAYVNRKWTLEDFPPHRGLTLRNVGASRMLNGCLLHINDMGVVTLDPTQGTTVLVESL